MCLIFPITLWPQHIKLNSVWSKITLLSKYRIQCQYNMGKTGRSLSNINLFGLLFLPVFAFQWNTFPNINSN